MKRINIDIKELYISKHNLIKPLPFADNSVNEINSKDNTIALFSIKEWKNLKREIVRVLRPGGKLDFVFLDVEYLVNKFLQDKSKNRWVWLKAIQDTQEGNEIAQNGFSPDKLTSDLREEGVENLSWKSWIDHELTHPRKWIHLTGFKKSLIITLLFLMFAPRLTWVGLTYFAIDLLSNSSGSPSISLTIFPKRKRKYFMSRLVGYSIEAHFFPPKRESFIRDEQNYIKYPSFKNFSA